MVFSFSPLGLFSKAPFLHRHWIGWSGPLALCGIPSTQHSAMPFNISISPTCYIIGIAVQCWWLMLQSSRCCRVPALYSSSLTWIKKGSKKNKNVSKIHFHSLAEGLQKDTHSNVHLLGHYLEPCWTLMRTCTQSCNTQSGPTVSWQ